MGPKGGCRGKVRRSQSRHSLSASELASASYSYSDKNSFETLRRRRKQSRIDAGWEGQRLLVGQREVNSWTGAEAGSIPCGKWHGCWLEEAAMILKAEPDSSPEREGTDASCSKVDGT